MLQLSMASATETRAFFWEIDGYACGFSGLSSPIVTNQIANWGTSQSEATTCNKPITDPRGCERLYNDSDLVLK